MTGVQGRKEEQVLPSVPERYSRKAGILPGTWTYLPMGNQQFLDGLSLADSYIKDGLHVQLLQVLMLLIPPAPEGMCVHWVSRCATGVRVGLDPPESLPCKDLVLGPEGHPGPYASIPESFAYPPGGPSTLPTPSPMLVPGSSTKRPGDSTCGSCLTLQIPSPEPGSCAGPAPAPQPPQAAAAPGHPCQAPRFLWFQEAVGMGKTETLRMTESSGRTKVLGWDSC